MSLPIQDNTSKRKHFSIVFAMVYSVAIPDPDGAANAREPGMGASCKESRMRITDTIALVLKNKPQRVLAIGPDQTVYEAIEKMARHDIGALLVMDEQGNLVGIVSERDYARKGVLMGHLSRETRVHQIMSSPVVYVSPQHTVDECMGIMTQHDFRHLPVKQDGKVVGVISISDLVRWVISGQEHAIEELQGYITGAYPG